MRLGVLIEKISFLAGGERPNLKAELMPLLGEIEIFNIGKALCLSIPKDPIFF